MTVAASFDNVGDTYDHVISVQEGSQRGYKRFKTIILYFNYF